LGRLREHWVHLRTTNPIESTFATVRHRTKVNAPHLVALVRAGAHFEHGRLVERPAAKPRREHDRSRLIKTSIH
jgi:transposase-like protein